MSPGQKESGGSMNTVTLRRYSEADTLREIFPRILVALTRAGLSTGGREKSNFLCAAFNL